MNQPGPELSDAHGLRRKAEKALQARILDNLDPAHLDVEEVRLMFHELQVHQIELEMQNEQLREAQCELLDARDRYTDLFDFAPVGYFILDPGGMILQVNLTGAQLLSVERQKLVGRPFHNFIAPAQRDRYYKSRRDLVAGSGPGIIELDVRRSDGSGFSGHLEWQTGLARNWEDGEIRLTLSDISEHKRLEEQRNQFFTIASHELRTPVTTMSLALDMLAQRDDIKASRGYPMVEMARNGVHRLGRLVHEIIDKQSLDSGRQPFSLRPIALESLLADMLGQCRPLADDAGMDLRMEGEAPDVWIRADTDRLMQVVFNLVSNALRYGPEGSTVRVGAQRIGDWVRVTVKDSGPGIPEAFRPHVFEPFTQADPALEDDQNRHGLGLGLSICKTIMQGMGGRVGFHTIPGVETGFYFELPVVR